MTLGILGILWFILPAYAANSFPVLLKGRRPLDRGRKLNGYRLLGDGKTIEGAVGGISFGFFLGFLQLISQSEITAQLGIELFTMTPEIIILLSIGAIVGDLAGSFIKRRHGIPRGSPVLFLDQLDFFIGAVLFSLVVFVPSLYFFLVLLVFTLLIHLLANVFAYTIRLKSNPY